ncbi:hypothetical protein BBK82_42625 [Lentzea guizhouensis]|uniref:Uncharacterized protein n=1 Tax=Lentzea guizhouensis TaxID=1586287 RepID=A0A1B2HVD7_9PSEU|nr:hypothetical protein [Lentzea guizhouensis]ANZ41657.1 hypothetical protein BBK82_42625 [Lentzea guizhouensis]
MELSGFGQELFHEAEKAPPLTDPVYLRHRRTATELARRSIDDVLAAHHLDVITAPTNGPAGCRAATRAAHALPRGAATRT